jgi:DNA-binding FadR family transcriptional regulator
MATSQRSWAGYDAQTTGRFTGRKIPNRATHQDVSAQIVAAIHLGELRSGDRVPSERALAEQLGASRGTVRKACQELAEAGVLEIRSRRGPGNGMYVRSDVVPAGAARLADQLPLSEIAGVLEARRLLEPRVAQLAGFLATNDDIAELERMIQAQRDAGDDEMRFRELNASFHLAIARASHNGTIVALMQTLQHRLGLARNPESLPNHISLSVPIHERIVDAIARHDPDQIEAAMLDDLALLEEAWRLQTGRVLTRRAPDFLQSLRSQPG